MSVFSDIGKEFTLSGPNNNTITKTSGDNVWNNSAFGRQIMKCGNNEIIQYEIQWDAYENGWWGSNIAVGIVSNLHDQNPNEYFKTQHSYLIGMVHGTVHIDGNKQNKTVHQCGQGDTLTLVINMAENRLYSIKNDNKNDIKTISNIKNEPNLTYRFALSVYRVGDSLSIKETKEKGDIKMDKMKSIIDALTNDNNKKQLEMDKYLHKNRQQMEIITLLKEETKRLNNILEDERKENEMNINKLKEENKKLKLLNINTNNYKQWNGDEIVHWIISLNPQIYGQYEQKLLKSLTEEQVNGECIDDIDVSDIKRWGIINFKHSKTLMKHITLLIENKQNKNNQNEMNEQIYNEGVNAYTAYM